MDTVPFEIILIIIDNLPNRDKIHYLSTNVTLDRKKHVVTYNDDVNVNDISHLSYIHKFTSICHSTYDLPIPQFVTRLTFCGGYSKLKMDDFPLNITHLTFGGIFNQPMCKNIPLVTHLTLGGCFNRSITTNIPRSVTHLKFGFHFNQIIKKGDIPSSVIHLTFGFSFNQQIDQHNIPSSVTHLKFKSPHRSIDSVPKTVRHIKFKGEWIKFDN
uniref:F-box domain-containing protein n=1 Tax=viral metagenome TaxID=1070528 RepID=A0A6C0C9X5_9ZZZZ